MPPKKTINKSEKAKAAELKKKNTAIAESIIAALDDEGSSVANGDVSVVQAPQRNAALRVTTRIKKKTSNEIVTPTSKMRIVPKSTAAAVTSFTDASPTSDLNVFPDISKSTDRDNTNNMNTASKILINNPVETELKRKRDKAEEETVKHLAVSKKKKIEIASPSNSDSNILLGPDARSNNVKGRELSKYLYEIDCNRVAEHVDATELQKYLQKEMKVHGCKNNLEENVTIICKDHKVVIQSKVYLPKRSLRFLSKKFLRKNWNIQVVSKCARSYEFKYIGTL